MDPLTIHIDLEPAYEPLRKWTIQMTNQHWNQPPPHKLNFTPHKQPVTRPTDHNTMQDLCKQKRIQTRHLTPNPAEDVQLPI